MFKHYFEQVEDVEIFPIISLLIFFFFFLALCVYVYRLPKKEIDELEHLPLED